MPIVNRARSLVAILTGFICLSPWTAWGADNDPPAFEVLGREHDATIRPLLAQFCITCHSTEKHKGEFDLEAYATIADYRRDPEVWEKIAEALDSREMPPKDQPQPTDAQRGAIRQWIKSSLDAEAAASPGDPGRVVTRRLTNVEYRNTIRDLLGLKEINPVREFPADGAAGEGFTNVSDALVMSPAMLDKYFAAAKETATHMVPLPDGIRFSEKATRADWTEEILNQIKAIYQQYTVPGDNEKVALQGLIWDSRGGGVIPLERYIAATLAHRDGGPDAKPLADLAAENHLSPRYLQTLWDALNGPRSSQVIEMVRERWRAAKPEEAAQVVNEIKRWQAALTKFGTVGHFKPWQGASNPITESQAFRIALAPKPGAKEVTVRLVATDAADGPAGDRIAWQEPRLEAKGRPTLLLRDLRAGLEQLRLSQRSLAETGRYLEAAADIQGGKAKGDARAIAVERSLDAGMLAAWLDLLGFAGSGNPPVIHELFTTKAERIGGYEFVKLWGSQETPSVTANASDAEVRIPGTMTPRSIALHPSPTQSAAVGWRSPLDGPVTIEAHVADAHPACGNGVVWSLELRRDAERRKLDGGVIGINQTSNSKPVDRLVLHKNDLVSLLVGSNRDHGCDQTRVDLTITELEGARRQWNLSKDVSGNLLASNPHADSLGNPEIWHFYQENSDEQAATALAVLPRGSVLDRWRDERDAEARGRLAEQVQRLLADGPKPETSEEDRQLHQQLTAITGPLFGRLDLGASGRGKEQAGESSTSHGLPASAFGSQKPDDTASANSLFVKAPSVVEIRLPAELAVGREFVTTAAIDPTEGTEGTAQARVLVDQEPSREAITPGLPILVANGGATRPRIEAAFDDFRGVFPAAVCYRQIVPVDEVVTVALYHREDEQLARLLLTDAERARLEKLWDELWFVSQEPLKVETGYVQFMEYVTQDGDPKLFQPLAKPIKERADAYRRQLLDVQGPQLDQVLNLAELAYRRPFRPGEREKLQTLYQTLRQEEIDHETALQLVLARVLVAPAFLYRVEEPAEGEEPQPVSSWELASRLSYFLWSSMPDAELRDAAAQGTLADPLVLEAQARRMLADPKARAFATEFACQWLDLRNFDEHNEKSEQTFPEFPALRGAMYEELVQFLLDLFQRDGSLIEVIDTDHTFLNEALAKHYGIPGVTGDAWRRVDGIKQHDRGGVLGMAALLSKQAGASRTSPILRGTWTLEMLLGEKVPKPPKDVPPLPESDLNSDKLSMRQITERHRAVESCARCHDKIDPYGFALEGYDAIGRRRKIDPHGQPVDTSAKLLDGTTFDDLDGLRRHLVAERQDGFTRHFGRKLLGYALGRSVQLADQTLLTSIQQNLAEHEYHVQGAIMTILKSPQFLQRRGLDSRLEQASR